MDRHPQNDWGSVNYDARFDIYWVQAGGAKQQLFYCPWCGEKLPPEQRDRWFDELEAKGIAPERGIPPPYDTGAWRGAVEEPPPERDRGAIEGRYIDLFEGGMRDEPPTDRGPPGLDLYELLYAERSSLLGFLAQAINECTVAARAAYGQPDAEDALGRLNEAVHRLSSHARDLADPDAPMSMSRANAIAADLTILPEARVAWLLETWPLT